MRNSELSTRLEEIWNEWNCVNPSNISVWHVVDLTNTKIIEPDHYWLYDDFWIAFGKGKQVRLLNDAARVQRERIRQTQRNGRAD